MSEATTAKGFPFGSVASSIFLMGPALSAQAEGAAVDIFLDIVILYRGPIVLFL